MSNKIVGRVHNEPQSRTSQSTLWVKEMVVGRVSNQLDRDASLKLESLKQEIGVVNNENRRTPGDREIRASTSQLIGRIHNEQNPHIPTAYNQ